MYLITSLIDKLTSMANSEFITVLQVSIPLFCIEMFIYLEQYKSNEKCSYHSTRKMLSKLLKCVGYRLPISIYILCRHLIPALNAWSAQAKYTTARPTASQVSRHGCMDELTTELSLICKLLVSLYVCMYV